MDLFTIASIVIVLSALFGYINVKLLRLGVLSSTFLVAAMVYFAFPLIGLDIEWMH